MSRFGMDSPFERLTRDFEKQLAQFRALAQPNWTRALDEIARAELAASRTLELVNQHHSRQLDALVAQIQHQSQHLDTVIGSAFSDLRNLLPALDAAHHASIHLAPEFVRSLNLAWESSVLSSRAELLRINELSMVAALPMLRSFDAAITQALSFQEQLKLESSFAARLLRQVTDIDAYAEDERSFSEGLAELVAAFLDKCRSLARDPTHAWGMFQTLLTLVIFLFGLWSDRAAENRLSGEINRVEQRSTDAIADAVRQMRTAIDQLRPAESNFVQYVVLRDVKLRVRPTAKSQSIRVLYPNEVAVLAGSKGTWIQVKVFDYINGSSHTGWVLKKYLKRLESPPSRPHPNP